MDAHIFIALVGALVNMGLSVTVPCLVKKSKQPFLAQVRKVFETNREVIVASSLIVGIVIYLALKVAPEIQPSFSSLTGLDIDSSTLSDFKGPPRIVNTGMAMPMAGGNNFSSQIRNLINLVDN